MKPEVASSKVKIDIDQRSRKQTNTGRRRKVFPFLDFKDSQKVIRDPYLRETGLEENKRKGTAERWVRKKAEIPLFSNKTVQT